MINLKNLNIILTGATGGIGGAILEKLYHFNAKIIATGTNENKLQELGETPLPKYITRPVEENDKDRFQTIYAKNEGAVAAPTAGLHFSKHFPFNITYDT